MTLRLNIVSFEEGNDGKKYSTVVGAAFEHSDKNGFDLVIRAFPLNGEFAILLPKDVDDEMPQREEMHWNALIQETVRSGTEEDPKYDNFYHKVGAVFPHKKGFTAKLFALPAAGNKLVIRKPLAKKEEQSS